MAIDLANRHMLITRPKPQGEALCHLIEAYGGMATHFPTIAFVPPPDQHAFLQKVNVLGHQDWLIFISPQAVFASCDAMKRVWNPDPPKVKFAAIGDGTKNALCKAGYPVTACPDTKWNSEGLLDLPEFQAIAGQKVAIIQGHSGSEHLCKTLALRGATVLPLIAYQRVVPTLTANESLSLIKARAIDIIVCTSFLGVQNLKIVFGQAGWPYIKDIPLLVVSERIKILAHDLGFQTIWVARNAGCKAIIDAILNIPFKP